MSLQVVALRLLDARAAAETRIALARRQTEVERKLMKAGVAVIRVVREERSRASAAAGRR